MLGEFCMKKIWNTPEIEELDISATQRTTESSADFDYLGCDVYNYSFYGSGEVTESIPFVLEPISKFY